MAGKKARPKDQQVSFDKLLARYANVATIITYLMPPAFQLLMQAFGWLWLSIFIFAIWATLIAVRDLKSQKRISFLSQILLALLLIPILGGIFSAMETKSEELDPCLDNDASFRPMEIDGVPLAGKPQNKQYDQLGLLCLFPIVLVTGALDHRIGILTKSILAASGYTIEFDLVIPTNLPNNLIVKPVLHDGNKPIGEYSEINPKRDQIVNVRIRVPESVGDVEIEMQLDLMIMLKSDAGQPPQSWQGELGVSNLLLIPQQPQGPINLTPSVVQTPTVTPLETPTLTPSPTQSVPTPTLEVTVEVDRQTTYCDNDLALDFSSNVVDWWYLVKPGETIMELAKFFYGNANEWPKIYAANISSLASQPVIYAGQVLIIPGVVVPILYTVQEGDNLQSVSANAYGLGAETRWCTIFKANSDSVGKNANHVLPGTILALYPLVKLAQNEIRVLPNETMNDIALGFFHDQRRLDWLCEVNGKSRLIGCDSLQALETLVLPDQLPLTTHTVLEGETWVDIAQQCYGATEGYIEAIQIANRRIVGIDPNWLRVGQQLQLWGCTVD